MLKKEEVYVRVSSEKKARKLCGLLEMFGENVYGETLERLKNGIVSDEYPYVGYSCNDWNGISHGRTIEYLTKVSLKELRNILAREKQPKDTTSLDSLKDRLIGVEGTRDRYLYEHELVIDILHEVIQGLEELKGK